MTRTITGTIKVQIGKYTTLKSLDGKDEAVFKELSFIGADMAEYGYSVVGSAVVTVTLNSPDTIAGDKVVALRKEVKKVQAEAQKTVTDLNRKINELLAITNDVEAA